MRASSSVHSWCHAPCDARATTWSVLVLTFPFASPSLPIFPWTLGSLRCISSRYQIPCKTVPFQTPFSFAFSVCHWCAPPFFDSLDGVKVQNDNASERADTRPAPSTERRLLLLLLLSLFSPRVPDVSASERAENMSGPSVER